MLTEPKLEQRDAQHYLGIAASVTMPEMATVVPALFPELFGWLGQRDIVPAGPPFIRYSVINMAASTTVEVGVPVAEPTAGDDRVRPGVLPAGRYAVVRYTGHPAGLYGANASLQGWGRDNGVAWAWRNGQAGEEWDSRVEFELTDPAVEPDMERWEHELVYMVAP